MGRFDYVKYDQGSVEQADSAKKIVQQLENLIGGIGYSLGTKEVMGSSARAKALAMTKLEECYMWIGKAIRDDQVARNGSAPLQEERKDG
jgi:polysaccharide deacetylase 2 family uncharacterized protein YibQ